MHAKAILAGVLAATSTVVAQDSPNSVSTEPTMTKPYPKDSWETKDPAKVIDACLETQISLGHGTNET
jgi:hypothetical protein